MNFLLTYRTTPHSTTNTPPCELFLGRSLRTRLDLIRPDLGMSVTQKQALQKRRHDQHCHLREFHIGQRVLVRNIRPGPRWVFGTIVKRTGPLSYVVQVSEGMLWRRHVDHLLEANDSPVSEVPDSTSLERSLHPTATPISEPEQKSPGVINHSTQPQQQQLPDAQTQSPDPEISSQPLVADGPIPAVNQDSPLPLRRSTRNPEASRQTDLYMMNREEEEMYCIEQQNYCPISVLYCYWTRSCVTLSTSHLISSSVFLSKHHLLNLSCVCEKINI